MSFPAEKRRKDGTDSRGISTESNDIKNPQRLRLYKYEEHLHGTITITTGHAPLATIYFGLIQIVCASRSIENCHMFPSGLRCCRPNYYDCGLFMFNMERLLPLRVPIFLVGFKYNYCTALHPSYRSNSQRTIFATQYA